MLLVVGLSFGRGQFFDGLCSFTPTDSVRLSPSESMPTGARRHLPPHRRTESTTPPQFLTDPLRFLSTAPPESLVMLPGIGPVIAERLIDARTGKSSFTAWEELLIIKGIGPKKLDRLRKLAGEGK
jgi:DNA uptake protein ComE-like DNA-binding protein